MRVAIFGGGTVGGGVCELLEKYYPEIQIVFLIVKNASRVRDFQVPKNCVLSSDPDVFWKAAQSVDVVVDAMGGLDLAWEVTSKCLSMGIAVVSGNKALISRKMAEIESIGGRFLFEAAVCGGIPVINALLRGMRGDSISQISGVMNGSTNWMLDKMDRDSVSYESLLVEASKLGYLEADPSADILGWDTRSKLCILARICFGRTLNENEVVCRGINRVTAADIAFAKSLEMRIKLIGRAWIDNGTVHAFVCTTFVKETDALGNLSGATNCVSFDAKYSGHNVLTGSGAGRYPTANSVVADILSLTEKPSGAKKNLFGDVQEPTKPFGRDFKAKFYIGSKFADTGIKLRAAGIEVTCIEQAFVTTENVLYSEVEALLRGDDSLIVF